MRDTHLRETLAPYACAVGAVFAAMLLTALLRLFGNPGVTPLFVGAVLVSAWYGGLVPGLVATALSALASGWLVLPHANSPEGALRLAVFTGIAVLASFLSAATRRSELLARRAQASAEKASAAKSRLLAMVSHDLRAPLDPIVLVAEMLKQDPYVPPRVRDDLGMIRRNVDLEVRLIDDLVDLTRVGSGKLHLEKRRVNVHEPLAEAVKVCEAEGAEKTLDLRLFPDAKDAMVVGDWDRLEQVFWNLIRNAVKFTPAGGTIAIRTHNGKEHRLIIDVTDTGMGIEPQRLDAIFKAFEQGDGDIASRFGGLGLGLAICQALVEAHGGTIAASSPGKGRGATFSISLPLAPPSETKETGNGAAKKLAS